MKRIICSWLALAIMISSFGIISVSAAEPPKMLSQKLTGKTICAAEAYFTETKGLSLTETQQTGFTANLKKGTVISILGKAAEDENRIYIKKTIDSQVYYGYILNDNISVNNKKTSTVKSVTKYNPYYKKKIKYNYIVKNKMPYYEFDQSGKKGKKINGLLVGYSCGPHAIAAALSALNGSIILPEEILANMSKDAIAPDYRGTSAEKVIKSVKPYVRKKHKLNYEYSIIKREEIFDYLKNGYMVITAVENKDNLALFTQNAHFILLAGYDKVGNVIVLNSNKRIGFFDSFSEERIKGNFPDNPNDRDIIAIKWKYDDSYEAVEAPYTAKLKESANVFNHYYHKGKFFKLKKNTKVTVLGKKENTYYIKYSYSGKTQNGFIDEEYI